MNDIDTTTNGAVLRRLSCIGLAAWLWTVCQPAMANTDLFEAHFTDNQAALSNPGMGWYIYYYDGPFDIGSFGVWGECHTWRTSGLAYDYPTVRKHVDLHCDRFKKTQLVISDDCVDSGRGMISYIHARNRGVSLRDDSILVGGPEHPHFHQAMAQDVWPTMPVIVETLDYPGLTPQWDGGRTFLQAVEDYHASYASIHGEPRRFLQDNRELVQQINLRLGYRLQLLQASWPKEYTIEPGASMNITALPKLNEGLLRTRSLRPFLASGEYDVYISVGTVAGKPTIELPLDDGDGRRRYRIGKIKLHVSQP